MENIGNEIAFYIIDNDKEQSDFIEWCNENNYQLSVNADTIKHIYAKALLFIFGAGYDIDYVIDSKFYESYLKS